MNDTWDRTYDVVVVGSGAAGLAAAITARLRGLTALVVEKTEVYGGSTALSGGAIWVPGNFHLDAAGLGDTPEKAAAYLDATVGDRVPAARKEAYLTHGPRMVREFHDRTDVRFVHTPGYSDYYPERLGGCPEGRSIEPQVFDFRRLDAGTRATMRRAGLPTYGLTITSKDFRQLNMVGRTWSGRRTAVKVAARAVGARLRGRELLSLGEALIARMRHSLDTLGGDLWLSAPLTGLVEADGRVTGVRVARGGRELTVRATGGVVLASGGFSHDQRLREKHLPAPTSTAWSSAAEGQTGDALEPATALGAATDLMDRVWGAPSVVPPDGRPFFLVADRGIPGMVIVDAAGDRYANEAAPYHEFVDAMYADDRPGKAATVPSWLLLDTTSKSRYLFMGLFPGQPFPKPWLESGFVKKAATVEELAGRIGIAPARLRATVDRFNGFARAGRDEDFHRGDSVYDRYYGDPTLPNPNLAPLEKGPYYAIPVHPGDIGTKGGLVTDATARVLREDGTAIDGLYASGNVSAAVMGETYPGPGATIGPAMTFSWLAAGHIARTRSRPAGSASTPSTPA
ncbi:FAD-dependent oxidoreductase [Streptomyces showdoensis]|uniref:3-oxosteroid 1-dehydrogenase n=1 Tax=Streptomyces showdoensis TaxID=68268 RepID=A0A2P2GQD1_STREW|nr:FAD-dependent oxidoreductase [Streptomyces showdoensis]KKZ73714.1 3-ketosteroid-delta-1-dehydrogenase [Streptomyces showdoensis]